MYSFVRLVSFLLLVSALSLNSGPSLAKEKLTHGVAKAASSGAKHEPSHEPDTGLADHCCAEFCAPDFGIQPNRSEFQAVWKCLKFANPPQDRNIRFDCSDGDPPVPRLFS